MKEIPWKENALTEDLPAHHQPLGHDMEVSGEAEELKWVEEEAEGEWEEGGGPLEYPFPGRPVPHLDPRTQSRLPGSG